MNVLIVNYSESEGGAARAANRLHKGLKQIGLDSWMLTGQKKSDDPYVLGPVSKWQKAVALLRPTLDTFPLYCCGHIPPVFSVNYVPDQVVKPINLKKSDVIHLHWIGKSYLRLENLKKFSRPIVWTLHDMWPFTGGCHYDAECGRYRELCGCCPQLKSRRANDLSRWIWKRKKKAWSRLNITLVSPSRWLAQCVKSSSLFKDNRVEVIPNCIDTLQYKPIQTQIARNILNLPQDKKIVLFGALGADSDQRKGMHFLHTALQKIYRTGRHKNIDLACFGSFRYPRELESYFNTRSFGILNDDVSLSIVYAAADVFVAPSVQDNLPNSVMESLACGTPCVGFNIGGMRDLIEHEQNGYLAQPFDPEDLAQGILWVLGDDARYLGLRSRARQKVEREFAIENIAKRYRDLYQELILDPSTTNHSPNRMQGE